MIHTEQYPAPEEDQLPSEEQENSEALSAEQRIAIVHGLVTAEFEGEEPDVLIPLSGGITRSPTSEIGYKSLSWSDVGELGISTGGRTRVIAAAEIAKAFPETPIVTNSHNRFDEEEPSMASISKAELVRRGIDSDRITLEEGSYNTITQLTEMVQLALENNWRNISLIVNEYYIPRLSELYHQLDHLVIDTDFQRQLTQFKETGGKVGFTSAEPVLRLISPLYDKYLGAVEQSEVFQKTVAAEAKGLQALRNGEYHPVTIKPAE